MTNRRQFTLDVQKTPDGTIVAVVSERGLPVATGSGPTVIRALDDVARRMKDFLKTNPEPR